MKERKIEIIKTLIGSHAHGLASAESDYDYRGVFVVPTSEILSLGYNYKATNWIEGQEDNTSYEIGHFLMLALKCNPSILEVFQAPRQDSLEITRVKNYIFGTELRKLFPYVWNPKDAYNAFIGYGLNQRKKMLDNHLTRWNKYGVAYLRTLSNLCDLLRNGTFSLEVKCPEFKAQLLKIKNFEMKPGEIIDLADEWTNFAKDLLVEYECGNKHQVPQPEKVNEFLLKVRKEFWS